MVTCCGKICTGNKNKIKLRKSTQIKSLLCKVCPRNVKFMLSSQNLKMKKLKQNKGEF